LIRFEPGSGTTTPATEQARTKRALVLPTVVVKDGRVFDAFTGPKGMPVEEWKRQWGDRYLEHDDASA
jgi:hypothetical protein